MQHFIQVTRLSHSIAIFLSLENEVGRLFQLMQIMEGGVGVAYKQGCLKSSETLPKFSSAIFSRQIGLTVDINLTATKLFKIAVRTTSRTAALAVCKSRIYKFILPAKKYEKKRPNKQG